MIVGYASAGPRQRVVIQVKLVVLQYANAELLQPVLDQQLHPTVTLPITYANVQLLFRLVQVESNVRVEHVSVSQCVFIAFRQIVIKPFYLIPFRLLFSTL